MVSRLKVLSELKEEEKKEEHKTEEEAVKDLQDGKLILVSDDESRENEGSSRIKECQSFGCYNQ